MLSDVLTGKFIKINKDIKISLFISGYTNVVLSFKKKKNNLWGPGSTCSTQQFSRSG